MATLSFVLSFSSVRLLSAGESFGFFSLHVSVFYHICEVLIQLYLIAP